MSERQGVHWIWTVAAVFAFTTSMFFYMEAVEERHRAQLARVKLDAAVAERRACGMDLDWCKTTAKGTCNYIVDYLRQNEARWTR